MTLSSFRPVKGGVSQGYVAYETESKDRVYMAWVSVIYGGESTFGLKVVRGNSPVNGIR